MGRSPWWLPWAVYGPLGALGAGLSWLYRGQVFSPPEGVRFAADPMWATTVGLIGACLVAWLTVRSTRWLVARTRWARALHLHLRALLLGASPTRLLTLAGASALAEELFFRAALLPWCGLLGSALVFGLLHFSSRDTYVAWMVWATLMGVVFGVLYVGSGTLLAPIVAHAAINYENMQYICNVDPTLSDTPRRPPHGVWPRRL